MARPVSALQYCGGPRSPGSPTGRPDARPVLLLHGGGQTRHSWSSCGAALAREGWYAIALDLRGHGESDWAPDAAYQPGDFGEEAGTLLNVQLAEAGKRLQAGPS